MINVLYHLYNRMLEQSPPIHKMVSIKIARRKNQDLSILMLVSCSPSLTCITLHFYLKRGHLPKPVTGNVSSEIGEAVHVKISLNSIQFTTITMRNKNIFFNDFRTSESTKELLEIYSVINEKPGQ